MHFWRVARRPFADLDGRGGELAGSRWHTRGRPVVACSTTGALAILELLVHLDLPIALLPDDAVLARIEAPDDLATEVVRPGELADGWRSRRGERVCRPLGDAWLRSRRTAILLVPSAIVPAEQNALINPSHRAAREITVADLMPLAWAEIEGRSEPEPERPIRRRG